MASMNHGATRPSPQGTPFWQFSLAFYRQPEVAAACIRLQDEAGVDVNLLFFLLWNASQKRRLSAVDVVAIDRAVADWRQTVVIPLRDLRRALKTAPASIEASAAELFRAKVKGLELESERLEQEALYDLGGSLTLGEAAASAEDAAQVNVAAYQTFLTRPFPKPAVGVLLDAFGKFQLAK
jgi:uncharacterized protein (TIGR02444 family)